MNARPVFSALVLSGVLSCFAETPGLLQAEATLVYDGGRSEQVWITGVGEAAIACRGEGQAEASVQKPRADIRSIYFHEVPAYKEAMDLFQGRRYAEARERFAEIKEALKGIQGLPGNPSTLAAFHELECLRHLSDFAGLAEALTGFSRQGLTCGHQLRQVDLYALWDAVRVKDWPRVEALCVERRAERLPGYQRAQLGFCHGLALEALGRPLEALNAYATAITADLAATENITHPAILHSLRILQQDPEVRHAIKAWGTAEQDPASPGYLRLQEAAGLVAMHELTLGGGRPLPAEFQGFAKYRDPGVEPPK